MKLNSENFDQSHFSHCRVILCLLWLRCKSFTPDALRVSYRDMLIIYLEHYCPQLIDFSRRIINRVRKGS